MEWTLKEKAKKELVDTGLGACIEGCFTKRVVINRQLLASLLSRRPAPIFGQEGPIQPEVFQVAQSLSPWPLPPLPPNQSFPFFYIGYRLHWINKIHRMEGDCEGSTFQGKKTNSQSDLDMFSCGNTSQRSQVFPDLNRPGLERENHTIYWSELTWVESKSKEWMEEKQDRELRSLSLSCHWESQVCNKTHWVWFRSCGFGQGRKRDKIPVMTWHLLSDFHWSRAARLD